MNLDVIELTKKLISYPTVSRESNLDLIEYIQYLLNSYKIKSQIQYNYDKNKANLIATIGPPEVPGILLSGHSDVVPTDDQDWSQDPFTATVINDKLYGRGSCDMKGFIASVLSCLPKISSLKNQLKKPLHLVFTYDEEVGCYGAKNLASLSSKYIQTEPWLSIIGEPSNMSLVNAHKGMYLLNTQIKGIPAHSSAPTNAVSAIQIAARLICFIEDFIKKKKISACSSSTNFNHPYSTMNIGSICGGTAVNIIAEDAEFDWEIRFISDREATELLDNFKNYSLQLINDSEKALDNRQLEIITTIASSLPSLLEKNRKTLTQRMSGLLDDLTLNQVDYCTEAGIYQKTWQCPTVICGPGSILQAHKPNEYVALEQLQKSVAFVERIIDKCVFEEV